MDLVRAIPVVIDGETELLAAYPALMRRLTIVLRDASEAEDVAQTPSPGSSDAMPEAGRGLATCQHGRGFATHLLY